MLELCMMILKYGKFYSGCPEMYLCIIMECSLLPLSQFFPFYVTKGIGVIVMPSLHKHSVLLLLFHCSHATLILPTHSLPPSYTKPPFSISNPSLSLSGELLPLVGILHVGKWRSKGKIATL